MPFVGGVLYHPNDMTPHFKQLPRSEKEQLYIKKMTELQRRRKNPIDDDWMMEEWTDEELDKDLEDTIRQLRFEKTYIWIWKGLTAAMVLWLIVDFLGQDKASQEKAIFNIMLFIAGYFVLIFLYEIRNNIRKTNDLIAKILQELKSRK